jgi:hypothetical protein
MYTRHPPTFSTDTPNPQRPSTVPSIHWWLIVTSCDDSTPGIIPPPSPMTRLTHKADNVDCVRHRRLSTGRRRLYYHAIVVHDVVAPIKRHVKNEVGVWIGCGEEARLDRLLVRLSRPSFADHYFYWGTTDDQYKSNCLRWSKNDTMIFRWIRFCEIYRLVVVFINTKYMTVNQQIINFADWQH